MALASLAHGQTLWDFTAFPEGLPTPKPAEGVRSVAAIGSASMDPRWQRPYSLASGTMALSAGGDGVLYQSWFYPLVGEGPRAVKWIGLLYGFFVDRYGNLREDSDHDGRLVYERDAILALKLDATGETSVAERYPDADGNGVPDTPFAVSKLDIRTLNGMWEAGVRLAKADPAGRHLFTWVDRNYDELVNDGEVIDFEPEHARVLAPYLQPTGGMTAASMIRFIRGEAVAGMRNRTMTIGDEESSDHVIWKLGDIVHSTPTVVGRPSERYDLLYGDESYTSFYRRYRHRRQVVYVGANDGILHAFNAGYYHPGDDPTTSQREHGWVSTVGPGGSSGPALGEELWGYVPYQLLPHVKWLMGRDYTHVYYVDLKPKITDARIFAPDDRHPNGWGTILIGGMRFGGSCGACSVNSGAPAWSIRDDFNGDGDRSDEEDVRTLYTAYFALDITDPDQLPRLLWSFSDIDLGLSTSYPAIVRTTPRGRAATDGTDARWFMVVGSGPTGYDQDSTQQGMLFAVDLQTGPTEANVESALVTVFPGEDKHASLRDPTSVDVDLDYRVDAVYVGAVVHPWHQRAIPWTGKLYRLSTSRGDPLPEHWGLEKENARVPTVLLGTVNGGGSSEQGEDVMSPIDVPDQEGRAPSEALGPIMGAPVVTVDEHNDVWVLFGTGRYAGSTNEPAVRQRMFGIKDAVLAGRCQEITITSCESQKLINVSTAEVCPHCRRGPQLNGVPGATAIFGRQPAALELQLRQADGWMLSLAERGESVMTAPTLIGGMVLIPAVVPGGAGERDESSLHAVYYATGTPFREPVVGDEPSTQGGTAVRRTVRLGRVGAPLRVSVHLGYQGRGTVGARDTPGCEGRATGFIRSTAGVVDRLCLRPALPVESRYVSWMLVRE